MGAIVRETCAITVAEGVTLDPEDRVAFLHDILDVAGGRASMLGGVLAGRRTEIDTNNGAAIIFANCHGTRGAQPRDVCPRERTRPSDRDGEP